MNPAIDRLAPTKVWQCFAGIAEIPRPSKKEEKIRAHVRDVAAKLGLKFHEDDTGNIVIEVPAAPGHEHTPIIVLQSHLDMVCEKNTGHDHDFLRDPISLILDKDEKSGEPIVRANGTTLGADNGIGAAMALAVAQTPELVHGPLELLFTIDEEDGMTGAKALEPTSFRGRHLLNLDSEEDDAFYIGCAGGCDTIMTLQRTARAPDPNCEIVEVSVDGLRGGHSGCDIHENRGNAIKLLTQLLLEVRTNEMRLLSLQGGSKRNAIPREATAVVAGAAGLEAGLVASTATIADEARDNGGEPAIQIKCRPYSSASTVKCCSSSDTRIILQTLADIPNGVIAMHPAVADLVETSNNLAVVQATQGEGTITFEIATLSRSSSTNAMSELCRRIATIAESSQAQVRTANAYPGWDPNTGSPLLKTCREIYTELFGRQPKVAAIHAGLECGIISKRVGEMEMISFGPRIEGAHSPDERVYVKSVEKSWRLLLAILKELATGSK